MISGTLAVLDEPADQPLSDFQDSDTRAIEVTETQTTFEDAAVQSGLVAGRVPDTRRAVSVTGGLIEVETRDTNRMEATSWVGDVAGAAWVCAESTHATENDFEAPWPFNIFEKRTGQNVRPVAIDPGAFAEAQEEAGRDSKVEYVGRTEGDDSTSIEWGKGATQSRATSADVGVALTTFWDGEFVRVIVYASGYIAVWEPEDWPASAFARFVTEEVLPAAYLAEDDEESGQATLDEAAADDFAAEVADELEGEGVDVDRNGGDVEITDNDGECERCGREVDHVVDGLCAICRDKRAEEEEEAAYERLETVNMTDGGEDDGE